MSDAMKDGEDLHRAFWEYCHGREVYGPTEWLPCVEAVAKKFPSLLPSDDDILETTYFPERRIGVGAMSGTLDLFYPSRNRRPVVIDWKLVASSTAFAIHLKPWAKYQTVEEFLQDSDKRRAQLAEQMLFYVVWVWDQAGGSDVEGVEFHHVAIERPDPRGKTRALDLAWLVSRASIEQSREAVLESRRSERLYRVDWSSPWAWS